MCLILENLFPRIRVESGSLFFVRWPESITSQEAQAWLPHPVSWSRPGSEVSNGPGSSGTKGLPGSPWRTVVSGISGG